MSLVMLIQIRQGSGEVVGRVKGVRVLLPQYLTQAGEGVLASAAEDGRLMRTSPYWRSSGVSAVNASGSTTVIASGSGSQVGRALNKRRGIGSGRQVGGQGQ
jgi:hypothetical protein